MSRDEFYARLADAKRDVGMVRDFCHYLAAEHVALEKEGIASLDKGFVDDLLLAVGICDDCPDPERCRHLLDHEVPTEDWRN